MGYVWMGWFRKPLIWRRGVCESFVEIFVVVGRLQDRDQGQGRDMDVPDVSGWLAFFFSLRHAD